MMRLPGAIAARSSPVTKISGWSVCCRMQLTTMSWSARKVAIGTGPAGAKCVAAARVVRVGFEVHDVGRVDR